MRRSNAESSDTVTAKQGFFDRTLALHTERLGVSCRVQAKALIEPDRGRFKFRSVCRQSGQNRNLWDFRIGGDPTATPNLESCLTASLDE
jgi:hypothetical protein